MEAIALTEDDLSALRRMSCVVRRDPFSLIPSRLEQVALLHEYAERHGGEFPVISAVHPDHPEWRWGRWVNTLSQGYLNGTLAADVAAAIDASAHWTSKINDLRAKQEAKSTQVPVPPRLDQVALLHEYAERHGGKFPAYGATHPDHPEWRWGQWVDALSQGYLKGTLAADVVTAMDASAHWTSKINDLRAKRTRRNGHQS